MRRLAFCLFIAALLCARAVAQGTTAQPLIVESLVCRGNASTSCTFILGQVYLAEGDVIDEEELQNAKLRLLFLRNFSAVSIYLEKGSTRGKARVVVEVLEAKPVTTEFAYTLFSQDASKGEDINGRYTNYNLFGRGKIFDARANIIAPWGGPTIRQYFARAQYIDPHLFDSKRNFFSAGASILHGSLAPSHGGILREQLSYDVTFGRRLWAFSYVTLGYQYRPLINVNSTERQGGNGHVEKVDSVRDDVLALGFGWNSEDDPYFPTRGSRLDLSVITADGRSDTPTAFYRHNWRWGRTVWSAHWERKEIFGLGVAHPFGPQYGEGAVRRARWFSGLTLAPNAFDSRNSEQRNLGVNAGVVLETRAYGIVKFQLSYSKKIER